MLHDFLFAPFADPATTQLYEQLATTLRADPSPTLLLGHFAVEDGGQPLDAVVIRPHSITVLVLVPRGGQLQMPALGYGGWPLNGRPLAGTTPEADNPYEQFRHQKTALATWLQPQFGPEQANLQFISGLVVFGAPVTFGPEVAEHLSQLPDDSFQLLSDAAQLPRRLAQLARPEIDLAEDDLTDWAHHLANNDAPKPEPAASTGRPLAGPVPAPGFLRRAWSWLGADDIPEDTPYGHPATQAAASSAEKQRLEQVQRDAQTQLQQQLQALEAREAERERRVEELRAELAQAPPVATEAQTLRDRLAAESQEKAVLQDSIRASRAESDRRNRDLDARIQHLGQLVEQLNNRPASSLPAASGGQRRRRSLPRIAAVAGVAALLGAGAWGVSRMDRPSPASTPAKAVRQPAAASRSTAGAAPTTTNPTPLAQRPPEPAAGESPASAPQHETAADPYEARYPYADGYARVKKNGAYTFVDQEGRPFSRTFLEARDFSESYAAVRDQRGWQYITGPEPEDPNTPPFLFHEAYSFHEGLARVRLDPGYTYITKRNLGGLGPSVFQLYEAATDFENGRAQVTLQGRSFTIDTNGQPVD